MEQRIYLNDDWEFTERYSEALLDMDYSGGELRRVRIPHTCKETPLHYFDESIYQMVCGYRRTLFVKEAWEGQKLLLTFAGAAHVAEVFVNGKKVCEHRNGYTAFTADIGGYVIYGKENRIVVRLDTREANNVPPFGYVVDYMTYGGIYRDVYLEIKPEVYLRDVFAKSRLINQVMNQALNPETESVEYSDIALETEITISAQTERMTIRQYLDGEDICPVKETKIKRNGEKPEDRTVKNAERAADKTTKTDERAVENALRTDEETTDISIALHYMLSAQSVWDVEHPHLHTLHTQLLQGENVIDEMQTVIGFRQSEFRKDGYYLNGRKLKIRGLNRHQSYPYVGYAMPQSMQELDAKILKEELGVNAVRTSHYPQSHYFLEACDRLGLLVFTELPGWQHIGDEEWKAQAVKNVEEMVQQYRNHPSIILWGVRVNESVDDDDFYRRTNEAAHRLDETRQTGGVRAHKNSHLLEDVYTYNDFLHDGATAGCEKKKKVIGNIQKPYLVTEYNGHMFPAKNFDSEEHRVEHALRHAKVLDAVAGEPGICGCFGWCMFDYNTHKDFGSGDRICYHGVMDMFRNPKYAAAVYESQSEEHTVLEVATTMDIGEHPGCNRGNTYLFTNADSVRMYKNRIFIREFNAKQSVCLNLKHGPILIDDFVGEQLINNENFKPKQAAMIKKALNAVARGGLSHLPLSIKWIAVKLLVFYRMKPQEAVDLYQKYIGDWGGSVTAYRFEAVENQKVVKTVCKEPVKKPDLRVEADHTNLKEKTSYDVSAVRIKAVDEYGNILPYYGEPVCLETEGAIELIGPHIISFSGGMTGTYIRTTGESGAAVLRIKCGDIEAELHYEVE